MLTNHYFDHGLSMLHLCLNYVCQAQEDERFASVYKAPPGPSRGLHSLEFAGVTGVRLGSRSSSKTYTKKACVLVCLLAWLVGWLARLLA